MFRSELPRIYELRTFCQTRCRRGRIFAISMSRLPKIPQKLKQFRDIERDLESVDPEAWCL